LNDQLDKTSLVFSSDRFTWYRPTSLDDLVTLKATYPDARLVIGNTEVGRQSSISASYCRFYVSFDLQIFMRLVEQNHIL